MFKNLKKRIKNFVKAEEGYSVESLTWTAVLGLGSATMAFGIYGANRFQAGGIADDLKAVVTPSVLPTATEQVSQLNAGYTGAITGMTISQQ